MLILDIKQNKYRVNIIDALLKLQRINKMQKHRN